MTPSRSATDWKGVTPWRVLVSKHLLRCCPYTHRNQRRRTSKHKRGNVWALEAATDRNWVTAQTFQKMLSSTSSGFPTDDQKPWEYMMNWKRWLPCDRVLQHMGNMVSHRAATAWKGGASHKIPTAEKNRLFWHLDLIWYQTWMGLPLMMGNKLAYRTAMYW